MIFKAELIDKIVRGDKTQTRRPVRPNEILSGDGEMVFIKLDKDKYRTKIGVGRDYAVVPGRGKSGVVWQPRTKTVIEKDALELAESHLRIPLADNFIPLRLRVLGIHCEDVRNISLEDTMAEGFDTRNEFWEVWCSFYDVPGLKIIAAHKPHNVIVQAGLLQERPDEKYQAWAYTFEVLR